MKEQLAEDAALEAQIEAEVDRALEPYKAIYPPDMLDEAQRLLRFSLRNDPATCQRLRLLRADPIVDESGKVSVGAFRANGVEKNVGKARAK